MDDEGIVENAAGLGEEVLGPGLRGLPSGTPGSARSAGSACSGPIELVADPPRARPLAPYGGSSPAMNAVVAACKAGGLLPFANFNRIHVVPPCTVTESEALEGLAILDAALDVTDARVASWPPG